MDCEASHHDQELVVRVPQALAEMVLGVGMSEAEAFELLQKCNLLKCLKFFEIEQERMAQAITTLDSEMKIGFGSATLETEAAQKPQEDNSEDEEKPHTITRMEESLRLDKKHQVVAAEHG